MKRLKVRDPWWKWVDVLAGNPDSFVTHGKLSGTKGMHSMGRLPSHYVHAMMDMDPEYTIYSYNTPIAWKADNVWIIPDIKYSRTTSGHQNKIRMVIGELYK